MANFSLAHAKTSKTEAGYANDPTDKGGETWAGIARKHWPAWRGWTLVDAAKKELGLKDTTKLPKDVREQLDELLFASKPLELLAALFYKENFWDLIDLDAEPSQLVAEKVYDIGVNMSTRVTKEFLLKARADL